MYQKESQPIDGYIAELQHQADKCGFGDKHDLLLGDRIIIGIHNAAVHEKLFRVRNLTLETIIATCRAADISKRHISLLAAASDGQEVAATVDNMSRDHSIQTRRQNNTTPKTTASIAGTKRREQRYSAQENSMQQVWSYARHYPAY